MWIVKIALRARYTFTVVSILLIIGGALSGQFRLHVRAPVGTRIEETQHVFSQVEGVIRSVIPKGEIGMVLANIGPPMNLNLALSDTATISSTAGEILVSLNQQKQAFAGTMALDAGAFDPRSRTLLLEIDVPNPDGPPVRRDVRPCQIRVAESHARAAGTG
jgi:hypothetical protein